METEREAEDLNWAFARGRRELQNELGFDGARNQEKKFIGCHLENVCIILIQESYIGIAECN